MSNCKRHSRQTTAPPLCCHTSCTRAAETLTDPVSANRKCYLPESTRRANPSSQTGFYCEPALDTGNLNTALIVEGLATRFCIPHGKRQVRPADSCRQHSHSQNHCKSSMHVAGPRWLPCYDSYQLTQARNENEKAIDSSSLFDRSAKEN